MFVEHTDNEVTAKSTHCTK